MIYPRLKLSRNLLTNDGVIFISIADHEYDNLKKTMDEIYGEVNFIGTIILQTATDNNPTQISTEHEYVVCYSKNKSFQNYWFGRSDSAEKIQNKYLQLLSKLGNNPSSIQIELRKWIKKNEKSLPKATHYDNVDEKGVFHDGDIANTRFGGYEYEILHPVTKKACRVPEKGFRYPESTMRQMISNNDILFGVDEKILIKPKKRVTNAKDMLRSIIYEDGRGSTKIVDNLLARNVFDNPKSHFLLRRLFGFVVTDGDIILDFFSGSASTAHAIFDLNVKENINVKSIQVQLPENIKESIKTASPKAKKSLQKAIDFLDHINKPCNICEIGKERIRRAAKKIKDETGADIDYGFRVYRLDDSNMNDVYYLPQDYDQGNVQGLANNIKMDRTSEDLLTQIILDWGLPLSLPIEQAEIGGKKVYKVAGDSLFACFDADINESFAEAVAEYKPHRLVFKDNSFSSNNAKINMKQVLMQLCPETEVKVI